MVWWNIPKSPWWWMSDELCGLASMTNVGPFSNWHINAGSGCIEPEEQIFSETPTRAFCRIMPSVWPPEVLTSSFFVTITWPAMWFQLNSVREAGYE